MSNSNVSAILSTESDSLPKVEAWSGCRPHTKDCHVLLSKASIDRMSRRMERMERRSTAAPMDFEFTSGARSELPPDSPFRRGIEAASAEKRSRMEMEAATMEPFSFGSKPSNVPFLFNIPSPPTPAPQWSSPEMVDIQMQDASPVRAAEEGNDQPTRPINLGAVKRVRKQRQKQLVNRHRNAGSEGDTDEDSSEDEPSRHRQLTSNSTHYTLNMAGSSPHPSHLPYTILGYTQVIFNSSLVLLVLYLLVSFILTVQHDVEQRIAQYTVDSMQEIALCTNFYSSNNCGTPLPALLQQCIEWEHCMTRDPSVIGRAKVGAEMLAEVINSFVEPISWKTLIFTLSSVSFFTIFVNAIINLYRSKHEPQEPSSRYAPIYNRDRPPLWWPQPEVDEAPSRRRKLLDGNSVKIP